MKKFFCIFICIALVLTLSSCKAESKKQEQSEREKYIARYERQVKAIGTTLDQELVEDFSGIPWTTDSVKFSDSGLIISLDSIREVIHIYELETEETLEITAEDIVDLYSFPNEEEQAELDKLVDWYCNNNGSDKKFAYMAFVSAAYELYQNNNGKPFLDKEEYMYTSEDDYALVGWAMENIDYDYINKVIENPDYDKHGECYVEFLYGLGLIDNIDGYHGRFPFEVPKRKPKR